MPLVVVYGMPNIVPEKDCLKLIGRIQKTVAKIPKLGIPAEEVEVYFPVDRVQSDLGSSLVVHVVGLFDKPERTAEVRNRLARAIGKTIEDFTRGRVGFIWPLSPSVKVLIESFQQEKGGYHEN